MAFEAPTDDEQRQQDGGLDGGHSHAWASMHRGVVGRSRSWPSEAVTRPREELGTDGVTSGEGVSNDSHDAR